MGELWWYTLCFFLISRAGDVVNFVIGVYLVPRKLDADVLGAVIPLTQVGTAVSLPLAILLLPSGKFLNVFAARGETGKCRALLQDTFLVSGLFTAGMALWLWLGGDAILSRLGVADRRLLWPIAAFALLACVQPMLESGAKSLKLFDTMLGSNAAAPYVRLVAMLLLLAPLGALGYMLAQLSSTLAISAVLLVSLLGAFRHMGRRTPYLREHGMEMLRYAAPLALFTLVSRIQGPIEPFVVRRWLPDDSAGYYYAATLGNIPGFFSAAMAPFLWTLVSERYEKGMSTTTLLIQSQAFNLAVGGGLTLLFALLMPVFFRIPGPWHAYAPYAGFVWQVSMVRTLRTSLDYFMAHENACRRFGYLWYVVPAMLAESALLYGLPGWGAFRPWLPEGLWRSVDAWLANAISLQFVLDIMIGTHVVFVAGLFLQLYLRQRRPAREP